MVRIISYRSCLFLVTVCLLATILVNRLWAVGCDEDCKEVKFHGHWESLMPEGNKRCWENGVVEMQLFVPRKMCRIPGPLDAAGVYVPAGTGEADKVCNKVSMNGAWELVLECTPACDPPEGTPVRKWIEADPGMPHAPPMGMGALPRGRCQLPPES
jgi:hypothetical protein